MTNILFTIFFTACWEGFFGLYCSKDCGHCLRNKHCSHETGDCFEGCKPGYKGNNCKESTDNSSHVNYHNIRLIRG